MGIVDFISLLWFLVSILFGLCIGSFLNVTIYRLPKMIQRQWQQDILYIDNKKIW